MTSIIEDAIRQAILPARTASRKKIRLTVVGGKGPRPGVDLDDSVSLLDLMDRRNTRVRADLYKVVDRVLETGTPVEIERRGRKVRIVPVSPASKLDNLVKRPGTIVGNPEGIVHLDWSDERKEGRKRRKRP